MCPACITTAALMAAGATSGAGVAALVAGKWRILLRWLEMQSVPLQDLSGLSVFYQDANHDIFHTYSVFGRGAENVLSTYMLLDLTPKGRNETGPQFNLTDSPGACVPGTNVLVTPVGVAGVHSFAPRKTPDNLYAQVRTMDRVTAQSTTDTATRLAHQD